MCVLENVQESVAEFLTDWFLVSRVLKLSEYTVFVPNIWMRTNKEEWAKYEKKIQHIGQVGQCSLNAVCYSHRDSKVYLRTTEIIN